MDFEYGPLLTHRHYIDDNICIYSILACGFLTVCYVASLYVWRSKLSRDHPSTIKRRFFSVSCMMFLAPFVTYFFLTTTSMSKGDVYDFLGLRMAGFIYAVINPLILTALLFLGPLTMQFFSGTWKLYAEWLEWFHSREAYSPVEKQSTNAANPVVRSVLVEVSFNKPVYWASSWQDLVWVRNHIMAPLSEEWVFRACMMPLLSQCEMFKPTTVVFVGPLLFGVAHFHHIYEQMKAGTEFQVALMISTFQFTYTSLFGAYSAFLFLRTGHFVAPLVAHMFCNHMGFPNFSEIGEFPLVQRIVIIMNFILGLTLWCWLLSPITNPFIYDNWLFWANTEQE